MIIIFLFSSWTIDVTPALIANGPPHRPILNKILVTETFIMIYYLLSFSFWLILFM